MIGKRMVGEIGEKFFEMGQSLGQQTKKQVIKGMPQAAKKQIMGDKRGSQQASAVAPSSAKASEGKKAMGDKAERKSEDTEDTEDTGREHFTHLLGPVKKMTPQQIQQAKKQDDILAAQQAAKVRAHIQQYGRQEQELEGYRAKKAGQMPAYIAGKPGEAVTPEEQAKKMEELKKKEEEEKKEAKPLLPPSVSQLFGTREKGKFVIG